MRIVDFDTFVALPNPVVFSEIGTSGLYERGDLIRSGAVAVDFFLTTIVPPTMAEDVDEIGQMARWGSYDAKARFCVFDATDLAQMKQLLG